MKNFKWTIGLAGATLALAMLDVAAAQTEPAGDLMRYANCKLATGPEMVKTVVIAGGAHSRPVQTSNGEKEVALELGRRMLFAFPGEDYFANVKAERLPADAWKDEKQTLIEGFDHLATEGGVSRNYALKPKMNGFEIYGLDREKLIGGILGIYMFFDDARHEVVTIHFLNQQPEKHFHTLEEYAKVRDEFLAGYTGCLAAK